MRTLSRGLCPANGLTLSRANRTRDRSTYDDEAAVGVGCSVELDRGPWNTKPELSLHRKGVCRARRYTQHPYCHDAIAMAFEERVKITGAVMDVQRYVAYSDSCLIKDATRFYASYLKNFMTRAVSMRLSFCLET